MNLDAFRLRSLKTRVTLFTLVVFIISIWALSYYASRMLKEDMQRMLGEQQSTAVSYLAADINQELEDRLNTLEKVAGIITPAILGDRSALQSLLSERLTLKDPFNAGVMVLGLDAITIAETPLSMGRIGMSYMDRDAVAVALKEGKPYIGRPVIGKKPITPAFDMVVPIRDMNGKVIGALVGVTNLDKINFLDKITKNRYGKSGYYLLEEPKGRLIITGTDRNRTMRSLPAEGINPLIDRHVLGYDETGITVNPIGVEVLASAKHIPVSGWFLVAALPTVEAFAPIYTMQLRILITTVFLTLLVAVLTWWMLRREFSPMVTATRTLAVMSDTNTHPQPLPIVRDDEIGKLIGGFNRLLEILKGRELALKESEFRWKFAIEGSGDGVWDWNIKTDETKYSKRWKEMLGYTEDDILPTNDEWINRIHPDDRSYVAGKMQAYLDGRMEFYVVEYRLKCKDGSHKWILGRGMVVSRTEDGEPLRMIGTHTDITEQKMLEEKLQSFNDKLKKQVEVEVESRMLAEEERQKEREALIQSSKMAELGNMLGAIIHQWKQPLNAIAIEVQDIRYAHEYGELTAGRINEIIASIMETIKFMNKTADDFRDFYKPSQQKKVFSVIEQVNLVLRLLAKQLTESNINIFVEGDESVCVAGFTSEFKQVVLNIINNAKDVVDERRTKDATLRIKVLTENEKAVLTICDNAGGIPSELLPAKLFEAFSSTKGESGTGIGLSLSRTIIEEKMQGRLSAQNINGGACFTIELPLA